MRRERLQPSRLIAESSSTPLLAQHQARIVKTTGDGILIEFASVVDAVRCAVVVQQRMEDRNTSVAQSQRGNGTFSREDFRFDQERNIYICPAGKVLTTTGHVGPDHTLRYLASLSGAVAAMVTTWRLAQEPFPDFIAAHRAPAALPVGRHTIRPRPD